MPLMIEPPKKTQGRGSAPGTRRRKSHSRRPQPSTEASLIPETGFKSPNTQFESFIGQELVDLQQKSTERAAEITKKPSSKNITKDATAPALFADKGPRQSQHVLCMDTRFIDTKAGRDAGLEIVDGFQSLVKYLRARGDYCNIMATTKSRREKRQQPTIDFATVQRSQESKISVPIQGVALHGSSFSTENEVAIPDGLSADSSWNLFTRMSKLIIIDPVSFLFRLSTSIFASFEQAFRP